MPVSPNDVQTAITLLGTDSAKLHAIVHGPATGAGSDVALESGTVPSVAKLLAQLALQVTTGFATGYVVIVADDAHRALATPAALGQLLVQVDTKAIYIASTLVQGTGWTYHPVQQVAADAAAAVAQVTVLAGQLAAKMTTATYVGGGATTAVRKAEFLTEAITFLAANTNSAPFFYGAEDGGTGFFPALQNNRVVGLVDGLARHGQLTNTARRCQGLGSNFLFVNAPARLAAWGGQGKFGTLAAGVSGTQSYFPRTTIARQQPDRNLPNFDPNVIYSSAGELSEVSSQGAVTMALSSNGLILVAGGGPGQGVKAMFGSGVDKTQPVFMPVYFNNGGVNVAIRLFDVVDSVDTTAAPNTYLTSCAIFVDVSENVWILSSNKSLSPYGAGLPTTPVETPAKLTPSFPSWDGKLIKKVRADVSGGIYILFTDGQLWAGGGSNNTGLLGTGGTGNLLNPAQIRTGVIDFEVSGQATNTSLALWVLEGLGTANSTFKGAGYNVNGQLGQAVGPTANKSSFVTIEPNFDVNLVRIGGTDTVTVFYRRSNGAWAGLGSNAMGVFGEGTTAATVNVPVTLAQLTLIIQNNVGFVNLVISGYKGKHAACVVTANGKAFCAGYNIEGGLANGTTTNTLSWTEVLWSPRDTTEKIIDVSACTSPTGGPGFTWLTNHGRALMAGAATYGFSTGVAPGATFNQLVAQPVDLGTL